jgi:type I restriction enzyme S subunit
MGDEGLRGLAGMSTELKQWPDVTLGEVCEFKYGKSLPEAQRTGGHVPVFGSNGPVGFHNKSITAGPTIVVGRKGSLGEVNFSPGPCWPIDTTYYIDSTATKADLRWLAYRLSALGLTSLNRAAAIPGLNREDAYRQRLLLPPPPEQRRIAEILDKVEELRTKRRVTLAQFDGLTQSIFLDMFGDPATNPKQWRVATLNEVSISIADGPFGSDMKLSDYVEEGVPVLQGKNITGNTFRWFDIRFVSQAKAATLERSTVRVGDHLLVKIGSIGYSAMIDHLPPGFASAVIPANLAKITPRHDLVRDAYLHVFLTNEKTQRGFVSIASKTAQPALSLGKIRSFEIPLPPLPLQQEFACRVTTVEHLKSIHRASMAKLDALFASVQYHAFRGEL